MNNYDDDNDDDDDDDDDDDIVVVLLKSRIPHACKIFPILFNATTIACFMLYFVSFPT